MKIFAIFALVAYASANKFVVDRQVIVEPGETRTEIVYEEPQVIYEEREPVVIVEQQQPQVIVQKQPQVHVQKQPQVVVQQPQPQVLVRPQSQVLVQPRPQVLVQPQPQVLVPQPQVLVPQPPQQVLVRPVQHGAGCKVTCPHGWNTWGPFTTQCYFMPPQPLPLDTFWNQAKYCQSIEPTSYPLVINSLLEQALATIVALHYAPAYALAGTNAHLWLGVFADRAGNWVSADGSKENPILSVAAKIVGGRHGSCMSADPKTLGVWLPRPCNDDSGAVICEMAPRPICDGSHGGMLPISPLALDNVKNIIPKMPSIPILGQVLGGGSLLGLGGDDKKPGGGGGLLGGILGVGK